MGNGYVVPPQDEIGRLLDLIRDLQTRIKELERATGSQLSQTVKTLQQLVAGLLAQTSVNVTGTVTAGGDITTSSGYLYSVAGYGYDITYSRRAAWFGNDGRLGWASSSIEKKNLVTDVPLPDPLKILEISDTYYVYKAEVDKRDNPENPEYNPDYVVHLEYGHIAERLHEAGLWQAVAYQDGKPAGIHDNVLAGFAIRAARFIWEKHLDLEQRVAALEGR